MKIVQIKGKEGLVASSGLKRKADLSFIKDPKIGEYVLLHAGFAIEKIRDIEAKKTLKALRSAKVTR